MKWNLNLYKTIKLITEALKTTQTSNRGLQDGATEEELQLEGEFADQLEQDLTAVYQYVLDNGLTDQVGNNREEIIAFILALLASSSLTVVQDLRQTLLNFSIAAFNVGGTLALEAMGITDQDFNLTNEEILGAIEERVDDLVDTESDISLLTTTATDLAIQVEKFDEEDDENDIVEALGIYILARALTRSITISQNESVHNSRKAITETYLRNGILKKRFRTQGDDKVCPICRPLNGNVYDVDDDSAPEIPNDLHIGCRCYYWPIIPDGWEPPDEIWIGV